MKRIKQWIIDYEKWSKEEMFLTIGSYEVMINKYTAYIYSSYIIAFFICIIKIIYFE